MRVGVDLDNTIVSYEKLTRQAARARGLIPEDVRGGKREIRDYLRARGRDEDWTELQGYLYGPGMGQACPFAGVLEFFLRCQKDGVETYVVSHRTRRPFRGKPHDLHRSALDWLEAEGFFDSARVGLSHDQVYLEETKADKLARIEQLDCDFFIDDLPEFLLEPRWPARVKRVLFDPGGSVKRDGRFRRTTSWEEIEALLLDTPGTLSSPLSSPLASSAARLLSRLGEEGDFDLRSLPGGANNRVFCLKRGEKRFLLKSYFRHGEDSRDRLGAEFAFSHFAWDHQIRCIPRPLASDPDSGTALYGFVEGQTPVTNDVTAEAVSQALTFYQALNHHRNTPEAAELPRASESCFSLEEHRTCLERRLGQLLPMEESSALHRQAAQLVREEILPRGRAVMEELARRADELGLALPGEISREDRCLSPSDFGFHNSVRTEEGRFVFIDFEYAGWDDPAKLVCDFFCQPAVPVPADCFDWFADGVLKGTTDPRHHRQRVDLLIPLYRVKWCCILLNDFLPTEGERRAFARGDSSDPGPERRLTAQLGRVRRALHTLDSEKTRSLP